MKLRRVRLPFVSVMVDIVFPFRKMSTKPDQAQLGIGQAKRPRAQVLPEGIVKLRLTAFSDAQYGGYKTGLSPISWGSID